MTDILDTALDSLAREFNAGGDLDTLAAKFLDAIEPAQQAAALRWIVAETISSLVAGSCLLDETDNHSYVIEDEISTRLSDAILAQGRTTTALRELAEDRIQAHARMIAVLAAAG